MRAERLHDGDGVEPLKQVGAHGHGDAERAENEGDERDEGENAGGAVERHGDGGVGLAVVGDLGFGQGVFDGGFEFGDFGVVGLWQLEEEALAGAGAGCEEVGVDEFGLGEEDARACGELSAEAVWFAGDNGLDGEGGVADGDAVAHIELEADEEVVPDGDVAVADGLGERHAGLERDGAVVGVLVCVDGFEADEQGIERVGGGAHGHHFSHWGDADALAGDGGVELSLLRGGGLLEHARAEVAGEDGACADEEGLAEGGGKAADAGERRNADGDGEDDEEEFAAAVAELAAGDAGGGGPGERGHLDRRQSGFRRVGQVGEESAVADCEDAGGVGGDRGIVGDEDEGGAFAAVEVEQKVHDLGAVFGVEIAGGLVCEDDGRAEDEGTGEGDALLFAAGKLDGVVIRAVGEADGGEQAAGAGEAFALGGGAVEFEGEQDVFKRGERGNELVALEDEADEGAAQGGEFVFGKVADGCALKDDVAAGGGVKAGEKTEECAFAAAGGSHDRDEFTGIDIKGDATQDFDGSRTVADGLRQTADTDAGNRRQSGWSHTVSIARNAGRGDTSSCTGTQV